MAQYYIVLAFLVSFCQSENEIHPLSDKFIEKVNSLATTWTAGRNFHEDTSMEHLHRLLGVDRHENEQHRLPLLQRPIPGDFEYPENFDPRENWPECESLREIRDQGSCGSCWAISSVSVMTDRTCIKSGGQINIHYSTEDLTSCCDQCGNGCNGGWPSYAFEYWRDEGIVSGGVHGSEDGCKPYSIPPCSHHVDNDLPECADYNLPTPNCSRQCQKKYDIKYTNDLHYAQKVYGVYGEVDIINELITNGPVVADFDVYQDFYQYKSGIYQHTFGTYCGGHAIKVLGYGIENGTKYWLCANSWNTGWGDNGYFKIMRGVDESGIEGRMNAGEPKL